MSEPLGLYLTRIREATPEEEERELEYAVIADADIVGELERDDALFLSVWELGVTQPGEERWLCLRVRYRVPRDDEQFGSSPSPHTMSKRKRQRARSFYHGGRLPDEVVALASLFLRRRLRLGPTVRRNGQPRMFSLSHGVLDEPLISGTTNLAELGRWLDLVVGLPQELQLPFSLAARLYQQALQLLDTKPDFAYLNLVSAIEALANLTKIAEPTIEDYDPDLADLLKQIDNTELRDRIEQCTLDHLNKGELKRRFVRFILDHVDDAFWKLDRPHDEYGNGWIDPAELRKLMERVYDQRSATLHQGRPFPPWVFSQPYKGAEVPLGCALRSAEGVWSREDFIPYPHFMERLVRYVLISFVKINSSLPSDVAEEPYGPRYPAS